MGGCGLYARSSGRSRIVARDARRAARTRAGACTRSPPAATCSAPARPASTSAGSRSATSSWPALLGGLRRHPGGVPHRARSTRCAAARRSCSWPSPAAVIGGTALPAASGTVIGALHRRAACSASCSDGFTSWASTPSPSTSIIGVAILVAMVAQHPSARLRASGGCSERDAPTRAAPERPAGREHRQALRRGRPRCATSRLRAATAARCSALIGDNGAGKSTLIKILTGFHQPDPGPVFVDGEQVALRSVDHARSLGIERVYQDLALVNELSVYHNMFLNRELITASGRSAAGQPRDAAARAPSYLDDIGIARSARSTPRSALLSGGQRQAIAVARVGLLAARRSCCSTSRWRRWARARAADHRPDPPS